MIKYPVILLFLFVAGMVHTQDIHFSQFYNSPLNLNPGKTGVFHGHQRIHAGYRTQWSNVVPWRTFTAAYDRKFIKKYCEEPKSFFSGGILLNYDRSSNLSELTLTNLNLTGSYTARINERNLLSFGGLLGIATRAFDENLLIWDKQWNGAAFDNSLTSGEAFDSDRVTYMETALGVNYRWQKSTRTKLDLGVGVFHVIEPSVGFYDRPDITLPRRFSLTAEGHFRLTRRFDINLNGMAQFQGPNTEYLFSGLGKIFIDQRRGRHLELHLGLGYRTTESLFPILAIQYNNIYASINYDIDLTDINNKGPGSVQPSTLELHFRYIIHRLPWKRKVCPIY